MDVLIPDIRREKLSLQARYIKMVEDVTESTSKIVCHLDLLQTIISPSGLLFSMTDNKFSILSGDEAVMVDFWVIVSEVKQVYEIDDEKCELDLIILSDFAEPKFINVPLLELNSSRWLDKLGVHYTFEKVQLRIVNRE